MTAACSRALALAGSCDVEVCVARMGEMLAVGGEGGFWGVMLVPSLFGAVMGLFNNGPKTSSPRPLGRAFMQAGLSYLIPK